MDNITGRAKGGKARQASLTPEQRKEAARKAALAKAEQAKLPEVTHAGQLKLGEVEIPCYVTSDGTRVLSGRGMQSALKLVSEEFASANRAPGTRFVEFLNNKTVNSLIFNERNVDEFSVIKARFQGNIIHGYKAEVLADVCEAMLEGRRAGAIKTDRLLKIADQCEILIRGFARVGITALVDEATGFQKDRAKDALAKILEAFVAKEIQPWVKTFPADYYEQLFRLYGYPFPPEGKPQWRPQFFGRITNEVVYNRLAPDLLPELKKAASKAEKKAKLHQWLTNELGHPKLREHLASIITLLKISKTPEQFKQLVDQVHPRFGESLSFDFMEKI